MKRTIFIIGIFVVSGFILGESTLVMATTTEATTTESVVTTPPVTTETITTRTTLPRTAQMRIMNLAANISNRFDAAVRRLSNIHDRLESRATKLDNEGVNTAPARQKIAEAKTYRENAAQSLATIDTVVAQFVGSETPRERWQLLKETYRSIAEQIRLSYQATVDALLLLRTATVVSPTTPDSPTEPSDVQ
jgi:hypothetical protein